MKRAPLTIRAFILVTLASETMPVAPCEIEEQWAERYEEPLYPGRLYRALSECKRLGLIVRYVRGAKTTERSVAYELTANGKLAAAEILSEMHALCVGD
jgi:DNA-binding PadR family transcriptional regulator